MEIEILQLIEGARRATGLTVIIDVFRAFSLECYLYQQGAENIIPVGEIEKAKELQLQNPDYILIGERNEIKINGFQYGNSPFQVRDTNFDGKTIVHTTSAGTQGIVNAVYASEIVTGSFVNASAIINYINLRKPSHVSLVCMGYSAKEPTEEDTFCADYIKCGLENRTSDFNKMVRTIRNTSGKRFFESTKAENNPSEDFELCLALNQFNFVIRAEKQKNGLIFNRKIEGF